VNPRATYRLQLRPGFGFREAATAVPYLAELGVSHLYLSPVLESATGSQHGYDVVDPEHVRGELGGEAGLRALIEATRAAGIGILLDIVPNHMSIAGRRNRWWLDVLENGAASAYAHYFDVDWTAGDDRVLLPILATRYGRALQDGTLAIVRDDRGRFLVRAGGELLPIAPRALGHVIRRAGERAGHAELAFVGDALAVLPMNADVDARQRRHRDKTVLMARLAELAEHEACARAIAAELAGVNADPVELDAVLEAQAYRLAHWSVAGSQLSYRRFFDISTLVGLRSEATDVFEAVHARVLSLVADGSIDGLRIDHVDGLREPGAYLARLVARAPGTWIVVEKILSGGERLPAQWAADGTTGYEVAELLAGLFVDPAGEAELTAAFEELTGQAWHPGAASRAARLAVMSDALHAELARLAELASRLCARVPTCRDYTRGELETALAEILAGFPTYRTYLEDSGPPAPGDDVDRARIAAAVAAARDARPDLDVDLLAFLESALAFELAQPDAIELAHRLQQTSGAIVAKGDEDTLCYRQVRLLSRCEVGAALRWFAYTAEHVHRALAGGRPRALLATSTHDTKRGEDVRARITVLSERPAQWISAVRRWRERAARYWTVEPDRVMEYTVWQTLVGAWPLPLERARGFVHKAAREARLRTSWRKPDAAYEAALEHWLDHVYADTELIADVTRFAAELAPHGDRNSLAQLVIKLAAPGVPDIYQGSELRDDSLVDPDNRRAVDLGARGDRLRWLADANVRAVVETGDLGTMKLWILRRMLGLRRREPHRWDGAYRALTAIGADAHRVFAFARGDELVAVVPRLAAAIDGWGATALELPAGSWRDVLSDRIHAGGVRAISELFAAFPVALLARA
jgi:(1->4)-alpha-D-glucan 1-alpha-D-glucosylmutase